MAELGGGVYVSRIDNDGWAPDEEVGGSVHMLFDEGDESKLGLWRAGPSESDRGGAPGQGDDHRP